MDIKQMLDKVKQRRDYPQVGMIVCHNGVVRGTSRDGRKVNGLRVAVNQEKLAQTIDKYKARGGITEILVQIDADRDLAVGDDVMLLVVAGDIRETVIATLSDTLNEIKTSVTTKTEYFA
jgi:molybdopterin synthase catalytic subunit